MITAYVVIWLLYWAADMVAGRLAGSPPRPIFSLLVNLAWPIVGPLCLIASANMVGMYRRADIKPPSRGAGVSE